MKIIEALKRMKLLEKRIETNNRNITEYSSKLSNEKPIFASEKIQEKEVKSLIQANKDLIIEILKLKRSIEVTNLTVTFTANNVTDTISGHLFRIRRLNHLIRNTYMALNANKIKPNSMNISNDIKIEKLYDEKEKQDGLRNIMDYESEVSAKLEVINATTDIIEEK